MPLRTAGQLPDVLQPTRADSARADSAPIVVAPLSLRCCKAMLGMHHWQHKCTTGCIIMLSMLNLRHRT